MNTWFAPVSEIPIVVVAGVDAELFLQGQLSQDIAGMISGEVKWTMVLEPDGKLGWLGWVLRRDTDSFVLIGSESNVEVLAARLRRFKLRVKVEIEIEPSWISRTTAPAGSEDGGIPLPFLESGVEISQQIFSSAPPLHTGVEALSADSIAQALVRGPSVLPMDAEDGMNPYELGGNVVAQCVSFEKGCYTGQELVARLDARGANVPQRLCGFEARSTVAFGEELFDGDEAVGSVRRHFFDAETGRARGLCLLKRKVNLETTTSLISRESPVQVFSL